MKLTTEERYYALAIFIAFILLLGFVGSMDVKTEQMEANAEVYNYQAEITQLQKDMMQMQATLDETSETLYTLLDQIEFEKGGLPEEFYWGEVK